MSPSTTAREQEDDPDRRSVLQDDGVAGGGQFVGNGEEGRDARHADGTDEDGEVDLQAVAGA